MRPTPKSIGPNLIKHASNPATHRCGGPAAGRDADGGGGSGAARAHGKCPHSRRPGGGCRGWPPQLLGAGRALESCGPCPHVAPVLLLLLLLLELELLLLLCLAGHQLEDALGPVRVGHQGRREDADGRPARRHGAAGGRCPARPLTARGFRPLLVRPCAAAVCVLAADGPDHAGLLPGCACCCGGRRDRLCVCVSRCVEVGRARRSVNRVVGASLDARRRPSRSQQRERKCARVASSHTAGSAAPRGGIRIEANPACDRPSQVRSSKAFDATTMRRAHA